MSCGISSFDGTLARGDFVNLAKDVRIIIKALLQQAADYEIGAKEKTHVAKTVRTCRPSGSPVA